MLGMETVAERMADDFVSHHPTMPRSGKAAQAVEAARCLEDSAHASMMTSVPHPGKTAAAASSTGLRLCYARLVQRTGKDPRTNPILRVGDHPDHCRSGPLESPHQSVEPGCGFVEAFEHVDLAVLADKRDGEAVAVREEG